MLLALRNVSSTAFRRGHATSKCNNNSKAWTSMMRSFTSTSIKYEGKLADYCDLHIVSSPYPPISSAPAPPLPEFLMADWGGKGGYLSNKVAILDGTTGLKRTFDEYYSATIGIAANLKYEMGIKESSTVCLYAPNHIDYLPVVTGVGLCGAKVTPVNPLYKVNELLLVLDRSRSSVLVAHKSTMDVALDAAKKSKYVKHVVIITDTVGEPLPEGVISLDSIKKHKKAFDDTVHLVHHDTAGHPYILPYSSGTTGLPKGVCLTHSNIVCNLLQMEQTESMPFPQDQKLICPLPFFHIYGLVVSLLYCAWKGNQLITMSGRFDLEQFCKLVDEHQPERTHLVPPILLQISKDPVVDKYNMSSIQCIVSAAAPLGPDITDAVTSRLNCGIKQLWGMSELSPVGTITSDYNVKSGSVGPLAASTYGKIIDVNGKSLGPNEPGELVIKGPQVMMGYMDDPDKTAECLSESGWLRTGDVAYYDDDGFFFITDRIKELIKVRGYAVAPAELEALLLTNEYVKDAAVIQIADDASGELPRAYIVLSEKAIAENITEKDIYEWVKEHVAPYKRLDGGIVFRDTIPKSASGKILRRILRDELKNEMAA